MLLLFCLRSQRSRSVWPSLVYSSDIGGGFDQPTIVTRQARPHKKALESEVQQTVAMLESTLEHDNERPTAIVKPAEYIDQWSGMAFEDQC